MASGDNGSAEKLQDRLKVGTYLPLPKTYIYHLFYPTLTNTALMKGVQREREEKLARFLNKFLSQYVSGDTEGFAHRAESEAKRLSSTCQYDDPYKLQLCSSLHGFHLNLCEMLCCSQHMH